MSSLYLSYIFSILTLAAILGSLAVSFNLLIGIARLFSICQAALAAIGAYTVAVGAVKYGIPYAPSLIIGVILGGAAGALVGALALRVADEYLAIATFAFQFVFTALAVNLIPLTGGASGIPGVPPPSIGPFIARSPGAFFCVAVIVLLCTLEVTRRVIDSPFGRSMKAVGQSESAARSLGRNPAKGKLQLFALSGALAALGGGLYASYLSFLEPSSVNIDLSILLLNIVIIGGAGTISGPLVGAAVMVLLPEFLSFVGVTGTAISYVREIVFGTILILVVAVFGRGIVASGNSIRPVPNRPRNSFDRKYPVFKGATLHAENLHKVFGGLVAVDDVLVTVPPAKITGMLGPNGAGKTTVFNLLTGFIRPDRGRITLDGVDMTSTSPERRCQNGVVRSFQDVRLFLEMSVLDNILVALPVTRHDSLLGALIFRRSMRIAEEQNVEAARELISLVGLENQENLTAAELSFGDQKLLSLARCLATNPKVLLLDEATAGLDPKTLARFIELVRQAAAGGLAICVVEHNMKVLRELADDLVFLHLGTVLRSGSPEIIMSDPELAALYFGADQSANDGIQQAPV